MPEAPARNGATARTMPTKRPTRIAFGPWRSKKPSTRASRGARDADPRPVGDQEAPPEPAAEHEAREVAGRGGEPHQQQHQRQRSRRPGRRPRRRARPRSRPARPGRRTRRSPGTPARRPARRSTSRACRTGRSAPASRSGSRMTPAVVSAKPSAAAKAIASSTAGGRRVMPPRGLRAPGAARRARPHGLDRRDLDRGLILARPARHRAAQPAERERARSAPGSRSPSRGTRAPTTIARSAATPNASSTPTSPPLAAPGTGTVLATWPRK